MSNKRKFARLGISLNIKWNKVAGEAESADVYEDMTDNIGEGGICLTTDKPVDVGDKLHLEIELPTRDVIRSEGKVKWAAKYEMQLAEDVTIYYVGIEFQNISEEDRKKLKELVG